MRRVAILLSALSMLGVMVQPAAAQEFGIHNLSLGSENEDGTAAIQAGAHPHSLRITLDANTTVDSDGVKTPVDEIRDLTIELPSGIVGTPTPVPPCSNVDFLTLIEPEPGQGSRSACPDSAAVGVGQVTVAIDPPAPGEEPPTYPFSVYNLPPPPGVAAKLGFLALGVPVTIEAELSPDPPYNILSRSTNVAQAARFYGVDVELWGNPTDPIHDSERGYCATAGGKCAVSLPHKPFLTMPRSCTGPLHSSFEISSWQDPDTKLRYPVESQGMSECAKVGFSPEISAQLTSNQASSPSGLNFELTIDDEGLIDPGDIADSDIKKAVVTLPEGVTVNPSLAGGLLTCSEEEFNNEALKFDPNKPGCPAASNVGTVEVETPLLEGELLKGRLFVASQYENPFGALIALYMVIKHPERGVLVKIPGRVEPNPVTGQLMTTFGEPGFEVPQFPLSDFRFHFREGGRSPLITPSRCGTYVTRAVLTPWSDPGKTLTKTAEFEINRGVGDGPCPPAGAPPFEPGFSAGTVNNSAGAYSPFLMQLTRRDGDQDLVRFDATLPPGMVAKLAGVTKCSDQQIAQIATRTGRQELESPSCPLNSRLGSVQAGAGAGSQLTYVPGSIYLAGPFAGAPLSVVAVVPAVAGPYDVGVVSVRQALSLDPISAEVKVDGSRSQPIPHILAGIPLKARDIRVSIDRPEFTLNPTNCSPMAVGASIWGGGLDPFSLADDRPVIRSQHFQAADCASLEFKPSVLLQLKGGTKRGQFPALRAELRPRPGDANLKSTVVRLPRSAFLEQGHFGTICTRVQFAADACPPGAIYGQVQAFSPLLDEPLQGPIYLRSSSHNLPDLVFDLKGLVDIEASARIDSKKGGIRATFSAIPDAPITKVVVSMQGGEKGLIVNSRNLCVRKSRATLELGAQNGMSRKLRPVVQATGCKKAKKRKSSARR